MATQNQNTTSNKSTGRPSQNDSQIGGRTAPKSPSTSTDRQGADSTRNTDIDSRRTISPSTSDDVSSKSASEDSDDLDDAGLDYKADGIEQERTDVHIPPGGKTQDPKLNVYGQNKSGREEAGISSQPKGADFSESSNDLEAQDASDVDSDMTQDLNSDSRSDSRLNTTSKSSSPKKDNFQH